MTARQKLRQNAIRLESARSKVTEFEQLVYRDIRELIKFEGHGSAGVLAEEIGVSASYLSDIRHGNRGIGAEVLAKLVKIGDEKA